MNSSKVVTSTYVFIIKKYSIVLMDYYNDDCYCLFILLFFPEINNILVMMIYFICVGISKWI